MKHVIIYTDGSSRGNPGPGGFGAVLRYQGQEKRISGGFRCTTNNRMEITAALEALRALREPCQVTLHSDSRYLVDAMTKGWLRNWERFGWRRKGEGGKAEPLRNADLWKQMAEAVQSHRVEWTWVRGHAGNRHNEICDALATAAADRPGLPPDEGYEASQRPGDLVNSGRRGRE